MFCIDRQMTLRKSATQTLRTAFPEKSNPYIYGVWDAQACANHGMDMKIDEIGPQPQHSTAQA